MSLESVLVLSVGPKIAKSIAKIWLQDSDFAQDISAGIIDGFAKWIKDVSAQSEGKRQLEKAGELVAKSLLPIFEKENANIDEGGQEAVAREVEKAFDKVRITAKMLVDQNLAPETLEKQLLNANPGATRDLSAAETALYRRIIKAASEHVVDISVKLPGFTKATLGELLTGQDRILSAVNETLAMVKTIQQASQASNPEEEEAAAFEARYLRTVARNLDQMEIFGADLSATSRNYPLSVAYIHVLAKARLHEDTDDEKQGQVEEDDEESVASIVEVLKCSDNLLIRGAAGSGKTTLLKWIAVRAASQSFEENLAAWNERIPFLIRLRQCEEGLPPPEDFPRLIAPNIAGTMPQGWVHDQLHSGRALVLVDGLDEVAESEREDVRKWIKELWEDYRDTNSIFMLTSRPVVDKGWMAQAGFDDAELQDMDLSEVDSFIEHWHAAIGEKIPEGEKAAVAVLEEQLKKTIRQNRGLRNIARSPLLCAMICALHRDRRQKLPRDRIELYRACVDMLIERLDIERGVELGDYPDLTGPQKQALLAYLAYHLQKNGLAEIDKEQAQTRLEYRLKNMRGTPEDASGENVLRLLVERTGVIREPVTNRIDFTHRTFEEYLAAKQAVDEDDFGVLLDHADDDRWRETIILAAGLARPKERNGFLRDIFEKGDRDANKRHQLHMLAVACLETSLDLDPEIEVEINARLQDLVPPKNLTEANVLASAGELAIPYLDGMQDRPVKQVAACIRALAVIGGDEALQIIGRYASDSRKGVIKELLRAATFFESEAYGRLILSNVQIKIWDVEFATTLEAVGQLTNLEQLRASHNSNIVDMSPLANLTNLVSLDLSGTTVSDITPLTNLTNLVSLDLRGTQVSNISPLATLTNLTTLGLTETNVSNIAPLANLTNLTELYLNRTSVSDSTPLTNLTNLTTLGLSETNVSNINPLTNLTNLTQLYLSRTAVSDITPLTNLINLTTLGLSRTAVSDITPLTNLINLTTLGLSETKVSDSTPLVNLTNLTALDLAGTVIRNINPLANLTNLTWLSLFRTPVSGIYPLGTLTNLTWLSLFGTSVNDINPLANLSMLTELNLSETQVSDIQPLANLTNLTELYLASTGVSDIRPLANLNMLTELNLSKTQVNDIQPLSTLTHLRYLWLLGVDVSPESLSVIQKSIPLLWIIGDDNYWSDMG